MYTYFFEQMCSNRLRGVVFCVPDFVQSPSRRKVAPVKCFNQAHFNKILLMQVLYKIALARLALEINTAPRVEYSLP